MHAIVRSDSSSSHHSPTNITLLPLQEPRLDLLNTPTVKGPASLAWISPQDTWDYVHPVVSISLRKLCTVDSSPQEYRAGPHIMLPVPQRLLSTPEPDTVMTVILTDHRTLEVGVALLLHKNDTSSRCWCPQRLKETRCSTQTHPFAWIDAMTWLSFYIPGPDRLENAEGHTRLGFKSGHVVLEPATLTTLWNLTLTRLLSPLHRDPSPGPAGYLVGTACILHRHVFLLPQRQCAGEE